MHAQAAAAINTVATYIFARTMMVLPLLFLFFFGECCKQCPYYISLHRYIICSGMSFQFLMYLVREINYVLLHTCLDYQRLHWVRRLDLNQRPLGYEPNELPDCSTPLHIINIINIIKIMSTSLL